MCVCDSHKQNSKLLFCSMMIASASQQLMTLEAKATKEKCGICCTPVSARGVLDCCSDIFCFSCIETWSAFTNLCPLCKLRFKFITFVATADDGDTSDAETQDAFFDFLGQERVENWIDEDEEEGTLSFPSYFIDEDAVVCLDGDGCRVRKGLSEKDGGSGLEDISVACDSCDCWYHAFCVGYNPDSQVERSWICPRCVGTGVLDLFKFQHASKILTSKCSSKNLSLDKGGTVTFVDEGETAVVVSMDANHGDVLDQSADHILQSADHILLGEGANFLTENSLDEPHSEPVIDFEETPMDFKLGPLKESSEETYNVSQVLLKQSEEHVLREVIDHSSVAEDKSLSYLNPMQQPSETCITIPTFERDNISDLVPSNSPKQVFEENDEASLTRSTQEEQNSKGVALDVGVSDRSAVDVGNVSENMDLVPRRESNEIQEDENLKKLATSEQQNKSPKMQDQLYRFSETTQKEKISNSKEEGSREIGRSNSLTMALQEASFDDAALKIVQKRDQAKPSSNKKVKESANKKPDARFSLTPNLLLVQKDLKPKSEVINELRELVEEPPIPSHKRVALSQINPNNSIASGSNRSIRTRKIVHRGSPHDENLSRIVNEMQQHLKQEAMALGIVSDDRRLDVMDEKFFTAFKTAVQKSQASLRQLHLASAKQIALRKSGAKVDKSRQSLTKKLYGGSGKRRQAWDRDWDISFWRERIAHDKKSRLSGKALLQQEMAHMEEALEESKKIENSELESLKSRVYLADTSLLPRQNDIKSLSEQILPKISPICSEKNKSLGQPKMTGAGLHGAASDATNSETSDKTQSLKTDKRKWALEVLARKTGQLDKIHRKNGSLLADLPEHMRPVLEYDRRSKVPTAARQIQLDRLIEQYLQHASIDLIGDNFECQAALSAAMRKEKEIYERSNSKGVYINLCVQALASLPNLAISCTEETLPDASLTENVPLPAMQTSDNVEIAVCMAWRAAGLISDSPQDSPASAREEAPVLSIHHIDAEVHSDWQCPDDAGNSSCVSASPTDDIQPNCRNVEALNPECINNKSGSDQPCSNEPEIIKDEEGCTGKMSLIDNNKNVEASDDGIPDWQMSMISERREHEVDCDQRWVQEANRDEHNPIQCQTDQEETSDSIHPCSSTDADIPAQAKRSAEIIDSLPDVTEDIKKQNQGRIEKISKKVETYVKEHIRPLHKSHIITTEQYKWAVTKTTNKVMQHHLQAKSADFLIAEGGKVRRLAEKYLQIYSEHIFPGGS